MTVINAFFGPLGPKEANLPSGWPRRLESSRAKPFLPERLPRGRRSSVRVNNELRIHYWGTSSHENSIGGTNKGPGFAGASSSRTRREALSSYA